MDDEGLTLDQQEEYDKELIKKAEELTTGLYAVDVLIPEIEPVIVILLDSLFKTDKSDHVGLAAIAKVLRGLLEDAAREEAVSWMKDGEWVGNGFYQGYRGNKS